jgi:hypothetical protein
MSDDGSGNLGVGRKMETGKVHELFFKRIMEMPQTAAKCMREKWKKQIGRRKW